MLFPRLSPAPLGISRSQNRNIIMTSLASGLSVPRLSLSGTRCDIRRSHAVRCSSDSNNNPAVGWFSVCLAYNFFPFRPRFLLRQCRSILFVLTK